MDNEVGVKLNYMKRINLGNYQHKEYAIELNGTESQLDEQFANKREKLQGFIEGMENLVDLAHAANQLKARLPEDPGSTGGNGSN